MSDIIETTHVLPIFHETGDFLVEFHPKATKNAGEPVVANIGGKIEKGETVLEAIMRETEEETGINIRFLRNDNFYFQEEVIRTINGINFRSQVFVLFLSTKDISFFQRNKNLWIGNMDDFKSQNFLTLMEKNDFINRMNVLQKFAKTIKNPKIFTIGE